MDFYESAFKHGFNKQDILHVVRNAITIDFLEDDLLLYLGPTISSELLEVITISRSNSEELAIHAMAMRKKYRLLLEQL